jgi:class 3 adenylate cyclase
METFGQWIGLIGGVLTILGVVAGLTRYFTQAQEKAARDKVEAEKRDLEGKVAGLQAQRDQLLGQIELAGRAGSAVLSQKAGLDSEVQSLMLALAASGASLYVPVRSPRGDVHGLAFLCIEPFSPQTERLRAKIIPLKSLAGRCFSTGEALVSVNASADPNHFKAAEKLSNYAPSTTLNAPLKDGDAVIGVLQLLRKEGEPAFSEADLARLAVLAAPIAARVATLAKLPDFMKLISPADDGAGAAGTVMYFDLSRSSLLFKEFSSSFALQLLNEYFEAMCEAAFRKGATLDNYMGDGALLRFNVPRPLPEHEFAAVEAALAMKRAFADIRDYWTSLNPALAAIHFRAGIASGRLLRANLGHSQVQSLTIVGPPIAVAASLCEAGERDRSIILLSAETIAVVRAKVEAKAVALPANAKALSFTDNAYELVGLL